MSAELKLYRLGALPKTSDLRDYKYSPSGSSLVELPSEYESYHPKAKDQGTVSSCVAHVASEITEYYNHIQSNEDYRMSPGFIYGYRYDYQGCGMYLRDALKTLQSIGTVPNEYFPYNKEVPEIIELLQSKLPSLMNSIGSKISTYYQINTNDYNAIKKSIMDSGPVMASIAWYEDSFLAQGNTLFSTHNKERLSGYHCILIYGWNTKGWKILNSWGSSWGDNGTAIIPYYYGLEEAWGVSDTITDDIHKPPQNKFIQMILKLLSKILNYIHRELLR